MELAVAGGKRLSGSVIASGSKNATLAVMAGALLAEGETLIENVPDIGDVGVIGHTLQEIGVSVKLALIPI